MDHAFNVTVAQQYSVNVALFIQHVKFWTFNNLANKKNLHDGNCWTFNTLFALLKIFPYWSKQTLETTIKRCIDEGLLVKGNYNQTKYDRTCWYGMTCKSIEFFDEFIDKELLELAPSLISGNQEMEILETRNRNLEIKTPIPDTKPDTKNINPIVPLKDFYFKEFWDAYPVKKDRKKCLALWNRKKLDPNAPLILEKLKIQKETDKQWLEGYIPNPLTYLRGERWEDEITPPKPKPLATQAEPKNSTAKEDTTVFAAFLGGIATDIKLGLIDKAEIPKISIDEWKTMNYGEDHRAYLKSLNIEARKVPIRP